MQIALILLALAQPPADGFAPPPLDWKTLEAPHLADHVQITSRDMFVKAGEAYFSPDSNWIIFQAVAVAAAGEEPEPFYQMYVAKLARNDGRITGIETPIRLSAPGTSNTCGWFHPTKPGRVLFSSTLVKPSNTDVPGYERGTGRYKWQFHREMEIVTADVPAIRGEAGAPAALAPLFSRDGYCAEASWDAKGELVLYAAFDMPRSLSLGRNHLDIKLLDPATGTHLPLVTADGYNGGPFFSPDGSAICYRSDRKGNSLLQLFVSTLARGEDGRVTGVKKEYQLTDNRHVNWAPFWHPSGAYLVYGTSEVSHSNYEVFAIGFDQAALDAGRPAPRVRLTHADGADVLPVFNAEGSLMMWTAQRGPMVAGEDRPSSQLWIASFKAGSVAFTPKAAD